MTGAHATARRFARRAVRSLRARLDPPGAAEVRNRLAGSYQPMSRAILPPAALYFAVITWAHYFDEEFRGFLVLGSISAITAMVCLLIFRDLARRHHGFGGLEFRAAIVFGLIFCNLVAHHVIHLEPAKLIYFLFLALVMASVSVSVRLSAASVLLSFAAIVWFGAQTGPEVRAQYSFIGLAGALVAFCMAALTRRAIRKELTAKMAAEELRKAAEARADRDMLTNLPNRRSFFRQLRGLVERVEAGGPGFVLGMVDIDGFKTVNDTHGHATGDALLAEAGRRLQAAAGSERFVARIASDEFMVLSDRPANAREIRRLGRELCAELARPYTLGGVRFAVTASAGFVPHGRAGLRAKDLIERAHFAIARARAEKRGVAVFSRRNEAEMQNLAVIEHTLRNCDKEAEMSVVFQPQVDIRTGRTTGFEALARWDSPTLGRVCSETFIRAAERAGIVEEVTLVLLRKALATAARWPDGLKLSFNLSVRDIMSPPAMRAILGALRKSGVRPESVEFEVTETMVTADFDRAARSLGQLRAAGARVALDDFGTGCANFAYIDKLSVDTIKIDRVFASRLADGGNTADILKSMIELCGLLKVGCIVEGVESEAEVRALRAIGARVVQGYLFGRPMPEEDIGGYLLREVAAAPKAISRAS